MCVCVCMRACCVCVRVRACCVCVYVLCMCVVCVRPCMRVHVYDNCTGNSNKEEAMIEVFLSGLPSLKVELQIDIATVLGWCALFSIL